MKVDSFEAKLMAPAKLAVMPTPEPVDVKPKL